MTLHEYPDLDQGTPEWHDQRRGMVTASAIGLLLSVSHLGAIGYGCTDCDAPANNPCRSKVKRGGESGSAIKTMHPARVAAAEANRESAPLVIEPATGDTVRNLTALLAAERITNYTEPTFQSDDMWRGVMDEPVARDLYTKHYAPVRESGFMVRDDWGFEIGYSPDGLVGDDGAIEVKSRRQKKQLLTVLANDVPAENYAQLQAALLVSGRAWIDYVSFSGGMAFWRKRVTPDPVWFDAIVAAVAAFEKTAELMVSKYLTAVDGLPMTERTSIELGMIS